MPLYRKKPVVVSATRWYKHGDHPQVRHRPSDYLPRPRSCGHCGGKHDVHGEIDTLEGIHIVCPGDWIITGVAGEHYPCKPHIFDATYEPVSAASET